MGIYHIFAIYYSCFLLLFLFFYFLVVVSLPCDIRVSLFFLHSLLACFSLCICSALFSAILCFFFTFFRFTLFALEINVAQKLRFDCRGARCQRRRQRQRQRLMVLVSCLRLRLIVDSSSGSWTCARCSAACRVRATRGTKTSTDATNSQAYKSHTRHKRSM